MQEGEIASNFEVLRKEERFSLVSLSYSGQNLEAKLNAFQRPTLEIISCSKILKKLPKSKPLKEKKILIIGGSRGLGASVATVASLLGAEVTITYMLGKLDAQNLQKDILTNTGAKINLIEFDIKSQPMNLLAKRYFDFMCYFPTHKINPSGQEAFHIKDFERYFYYYCSALNN